MVLHYITQSSLSHTHQFGNVGIIVLFSSLFTSIDISKCEIRNQGVNEDYILRLNAPLD